MFEATSGLGGRVAGAGYMGLLRRQSAVAVLEARQDAGFDEDDLGWAVAGIAYLAAQTAPVMMADLELLRRRVEARLSGSRQPQFRFKARS